MKINKVSPITTSLLLFAALALSLLPASLQAQSGVWTSTASGNWSDTTKWSGGTVASGAANVADFSTTSTYSFRVINATSIPTAFNIAAFAQFDTSAFVGFANQFSFQLTNVSNAVYLNMSNIVPLGLGIADGTNYALYGVLGASPAAGLVFTMINRVRTCVLAVMGLAVLAIANALRRA